MAILEVSIGLVLVFLLLSLLCSVMQEFIATYMGLRSKQLRAGIERLLSGQALSAAGPEGELAQKLLMHPLVGGMAKDEGGMPSYVPTRNFVLALADVIGAKQGGTPLASLQESISRLPDGEAKKAITALLVDASGNVATVEQRLAAWYDDAMDRVGGWYKRKAQNILLVLGFGVAVALNVDAIDIAQQLWRQPALRQTAVETAEILTAQGSAPGKLAPQVQAELDKLRAANLPLVLPPAWLEPTRFTWLAFLGSIMGWLVTATAVSLGAQFWFELMVKLVNLRGSGIKPERATQRGSESISGAAQVPAVVGGAPAPVDPARSNGEPFPGALNDFERTSISREDVRDIQALVGIPAAARTGLLDQATRAAIAERQRAFGMESSGALSYEFVAKLRRSRSG